jgi:hypothetical protein
MTSKLGGMRMRPVLQVGITTLAFDEFEANSKKTMPTIGYDL